MRKTQTKREEEKARIEADRMEKSCELILQTLCRNHFNQHDAPTLWLRYAVQLSVSLQLSPVTVLFVCSCFRIYTIDWWIVCASTYFFSSAGHSFGSFESKLCMPINKKRTMTSERFVAFNRYLATGILSRFCFRMLMNSQFSHNAMTYNGKCIGFDWLMDRSVDE